MLHSPPTTQICQNGIALLQLFFRGIRTTSVTSHIIPCTSLEVNVYSQYEFGVVVTWSAKHL